MGMEKALLTQVDWRSERRNLRDSERIKNLIISASCAKFWHHPWYIWSSQSNKVIVPAPMMRDAGNLSSFFPRQAMHPLQTWILLLLKGYGCLTGTGFSGSQISYYIWQEINVSQSNFLLLPSYFKFVSEPQYSNSQKFPLFLFWAIFMVYFLCQSLSYCSFYFLSVIPDQYQCLHCWDENQFWPFFLILMSYLFKY